MPKQYRKDRGERVHPLLFPQELHVHQRGRPCTGTKQETRANRISMGCPHCRHFVEFSQGLVFCPSSLRERRTSHFRRRGLLTTRIWCSEDEGGSWKNIYIHGMKNRETQKTALISLPKKCAFCNVGRSRRNSNSMNPNRPIVHMERAGGERGAFRWCEEDVLCVHGALSKIHT